ncbi:MAG: hypothetical protein RLZZ58_1778 [Pseudomonadota bacterium]|jgi:small-conductance mechanosensitive channel
MTALPLAPAANPAATVLDRLNGEWLVIRDWVAAHAVAIGVALVLGTALYAALHLLRTYARRRARRKEPSLTITDILWRALARTATPTMLVVVLRLVAGQAQPPAAVTNAIAIAFTAAIALQGAIWAREIILGVVQRRAAEDGNETLANAAPIIRLLVSLTLFAIAAIVILDNVGVNVTGLIAGLGIGGIAIGLAAQGIFSDLFAALSIIFDRPFRKGETISFDTTTATVERIGLKSTRLRSVNGELLVVSNTNLLAKEISNFAHLDRRRVRLMFGLVYHTPVDMLRALPDRLAALAVPGGHEFIRAGVRALGASTIDCELVVDVHSDDLAAVLAARHTLAIDLLENLAAGGYALGYPTQTTYTAAPDGTLVMPYAASPTPRADPPRG